ncbi:unnamed protein product [Arctia plantaginis]|uniref:Uncharacterized protein n=1 Tax=Arctia plantaginis TaxID=874455 RepID=A0A8S0ZQM7_ARCPL|nr:unnamed protein product [Arctia plantaginis]
MQTPNQENPTPTNNQLSSSWTNEEASLFAFDDIYVTACTEEGSQTTDVKPQLYLQSLETRVAKALAASKGFTDLIEIAEAYDDDKKLNIRLNTTPVSSNEFDALISGIEKKDVAMINTEYGVFEVPMPTTSAIPKYQKVLNATATAAIKTLCDTSLLMHKRGIDVAKLSAHIQSVSKSAVARHSKSFDRKDVTESILNVLIVERVKERQLQAICNHYSKPEMWFDPLSSGLWIVNPDENHPAILASRERRVISTYELDDNLTQSLIALSFSRKPRETAAAKLNLFSRVKGSKRDDIKADPKKVLAAVFSESELTQSEIKAMLFTKPREPATMCPYCDVPVELDGVTYHTECLVVKWLVKHFFFKYDSELEILSTQRIVILDHNQRAMLEMIQRHHRTLNQPFKIKGGAKYQVMQREGDSLRTLTTLSTNPQFVPGTSEWLEKQRKEEEARKRR